MTEFSFQFSEMGKRGVSPSRGLFIHNALYSRMRMRPEPVLQCLKDKSRSPLLNHAQTGSSLCMTKNDNTNPQPIKSITANENTTNYYLTTSVTTVRLANYFWHDLTVPETPLTILKRSLHAPLGVVTILYRWMTTHACWNINKCSLFLHTMWVWAPPSVFSQTWKD